MTHAWCRDPTRDERVRAAEDGRDGPLPTLEQCIEQAKQAAMTAGVKEAFIKSDTGWVPLTREHLRGLEAMLPKSGSASSAVDQENKGDGMRTDGLRTERVTLEITHDDDCTAESVAGWVDAKLTSKGSSVRVVPDSAGSPGIADCRKYADGMACDEDRDFAHGLINERDAAIRERDAAKADAVAKWTAMNIAICQLGDVRSERDALQARVAELQAASGGGEGEPVACQNCGGAEMVWCDHVRRHIDCYCARDVACDDAGQSRVIDVGNESSAPPQPRGWLTERDRKTLIDAAVFLSGKGERGMSEAIEWILARSTPPEVVHPDCHFDEFSGCSAVHAWNICAADFRKALAAAGVAVKEVGSE